MAGRDRFARITANGLLMRTPNDAQPQKTNGVEDNLLDVRIWLLFFGLMISAAVVGYAIARSTKLAAPSATTATAAASTAASAVPWTLPNGDLLDTSVTQQPSVATARVSKFAVALTMPLTARSIDDTFAANPVTSPDRTVYLQDLDSDVSAVDRARTASVSAGLGRGQGWLSPHLGRESG